MEVAARHCIKEVYAPRFHLLLMLRVLKYGSLRYLNLEFVFDLGFVRSVKIDGLGWQIFYFKTLAQHRRPKDCSRADEVVQHSWT